MVRVSRVERQTIPAHGEPLDHEPPFPEHQDDVPVLGFQAAINDEGVALVDPEPSHAVPFGGGEERSYRIADAVLIEAERVLGPEEVLCWAWEAARDAHTQDGQCMGRCGGAESAQEAWRGDGVHSGRVRES